MSATAIVITLFLQAECDDSVEIFSEVLQLVREASRGKGEIPKRIFHLRTKHVESFRNLRLYEQVINRLVETSAIGVTNFRKHVHELFDWRSVDQTSTKNLFFHEIEGLGFGSYHNLIA